MDPQPPIVPETPVSPTIPDSSPQIPKDSHWITILAMGLFVIASLAIVAFLYYQNQQLKGMIASYQAIALASPEPLAEAETADWKTYTNNQFGFEFKSPNLLKTSNIDGSVTVSSKTYQTKQLTMEDSLVMSDVTVRIIYGWTKPGIDPYGNSTFTKQITNGNTWYTAYTENVTNEPGCFSASAHTLTADQKNTIELGVVETCPSDLMLKKSLNELNQILSTFKFTEATPLSTPSASPTSY